MSTDSERVFDGITEISDETIEELYSTKTSEIRKRQKKKRRWPIAVSTAAAAAVIAVVISYLLSGGTLSAYALAEPDYPKEKQHMERESGFMDQYLTVIIPEMLETEENENVVFSPVNLYLALGMLSELTDGNTRAEILSLLGSADVETQRTRSYQLWNDCYQDSNKSQCILTSSIWLDKGTSYREEAIDILKNWYYAASYSGEMGSRGFNKALQRWLSDGTKGKLDESVKNIALSPDDVFALLQTVYFREKWHSEFKASDTKSDIFHAPGGDIERDFMHQKLESSTCWGAENFTAVWQSLQFSDMYYILPDEGLAPKDLLQDPEFLSFMTDEGRHGWSDTKYMKVNLSVPKFDVSSETDLLPHLESLGIRDVMNREKADFSALTETGPVWLTRGTQATRVKIDEKGCEGISYISFAGSGAALPPEEEMDFKLDRPFIFVVCDRGNAGRCLFAGVVNQP